MRFGGNHDVERYVFQEDKWTIHDSINMQYYHGGAALLSLMQVIVSFCFLKSSIDCGALPINHSNEYRKRGVPVLIYSYTASTVVTIELKSLSNLFCKAVRSKV
uniref:Uncharacterized protein n=1 Tax=Glossina brevipalpis TaxID=37001 RepID=A0A1A9X3W5_9MUSC